MVVKISPAGRNDNRGEKVPSAMCQVCLELKHPGYECKGLRPKTGAGDGVGIIKGERWLDHRAGACAAARRGNGS